ncbi:hypothetical protein D3C74_268240 [compost metagenome]
MLIAPSIAFDAAKHTTRRTTVAQLNHVQRVRRPMRRSMNTATSTLSSATAYAVRMSPRYGSMTNGKSSDAASAPK